MNDRLLWPAHRHKPVSRRGVVLGGVIAGVSTVLGASALKADSARADMHADATSDAASDAEILNKALYYEHQAIWAYGAAAGQLSDTEVGRLVKSLALKNQADHITHRDTLIEVVTSLGGTPVVAEESYDVSSYIENGEGGLDSDVNIAKLALALETDAAIAYGTEVASLKTPALITAGAGIGATEASHATAIRAVFISLGVEIPLVPAAFVTAETRDAWILKV